MRRDGVTQPEGILDVVDGDEHLVRDSPGEADVLLKLGAHRAYQSLDLGRDRLLAAEIPDPDPHRVSVPHVPEDANPRQALDQHADRPVGQAQELQNTGDRSHPVDILAARVAHVHPLLCGHHDDAVLGHGRLQGRDGSRPPDQERDDHVGEDHDVPQRQQGQDIVDFKRLALAFEAEHSPSNAGLTGRRVTGNRRSALLAFPALLEDEDGFPLFEHGLAGHDALLEVLP